MQEIRDERGLRDYLYDHIEGLEEANSKQETFDAAFLLREWATARREAWRSDSVSRDARGHVELPAIGCTLCPVPQALG